MAVDPGTGQHSGRHAFVHKLKDLRYELAGNQLEDAFGRSEALADRKKHVYGEDIDALVDTEIATAQDRIRLVSLSIIAGTHGFLPIMIVFIVATVLTLGRGMAPRRAVTY